MKRTLHRWPVRALAHFSIMVALAVLPACSTATKPRIETASSSLQDRYVKHQYRIPMRDGATLFTAVYSPRDTSRTYPMLMLRTP